nr:ParA family protein [Maricaulis parjimensis]
MTEEDPNNRCQVVVFASQKGGSGKTTVSAHMAVEAERAGAGPVALIDTDPQGSMAKWWNARSSDTPAFAQISVPDLARDIKVLAKAGYRLIIIDTPPAVTSTIAEVITHADLVVVPTRPSPHDLRAVGPTVDIVQMQGKPLVFVVNSATARARITGETAVALSQHGTVAPITLHHRVDFAASMIDGRTVGEVNEASRSAEEVATLWRYFEDRLMRMRGDKLEIMGHPPRRTFEQDILTPASAGMATSDEDDEEFRIENQPGYALPGQAPSFGATPPPTADAAPPPPPSNSNWDGIDRRKSDMGPPKGQADRRRAHQPFGRRHMA